MRLYIFLLSLLLISLTSFAQVKEDSSLNNAIPDTSIKQIPVHKEEKQAPVDTVALMPKPALDSSWKSIVNSFKGKSFRELVFSHHPYFTFDGPRVIAGSDIKKFEGKELIFYTLIGLLLLFALLKMVFAKYVNDLFRLFFRRTLKQRQITEQLSQTPLPSLIFNAFFIIIAGLYLSFILQHYGMETGKNFWLLTFYCCVGLSIMYLVKFLGLKFTGWVLNLSSATDSYIFIVFIINKVIGIFLLPFLILLAFTRDDVYQVAIILSLCCISCLYIYRFILSYSAIHNQIRVKPFHFLIYLIAFEVVPMLLIYKLLFRFLF